jgi:hypothetical protein
VAAVWTSHRSAADSGCIHFLGVFRCGSSEVRVTDGVRHHQIYPTSKQFLQIFLETKLGSEGVLRSRCELDEKVDIAAFLVEALGGS